MAPCTFECGDLRLLHDIVTWISQNVINHIEHMIRIKQPCSYVLTGIWMVFYFLFKFAVIAQLETWSLECAFSNLNQQKLANCPFLCIINFTSKFH